MGNLDTYKMEEIVNYFQYVLKIPIALIEWKNYKEDELVTEVQNILKTVSKIHTDTFGDPTKQLFDFHLFIIGFDHMSLCSVINRVMYVINSGCKSHNDPAILIKNALEIVSK